MRIKISRVCTENAEQGFHVECLPSNDGAEALPWTLKLLRYAMLGLVVCVCLFTIALSVVFLEHRFKIQK